MSNHIKGVFITLLSIAFLSPDTLLFRLLDISAWDVLFWRGILVAIGIFIFSKSIGLPIIDTITKGGKSSVIIALFDAASNIFFYSALSFTSVANTLIILSSVPIFAAVLGHFFLEDSIKLRIWVAISAVCLSVTVLVSGSQQPGNFLGDLFALGAAISIAISLVAIRNCRSVDMTPITGVANLLTSLIVLPIANPMVVLNKNSLIVLLLLMGIFSTLALIFLVIAPRYINAAEISLFFPLETVLGAFLVWLFIGERIKNQTWIGGTIILCTVFLYSWCEYKESRRPLASSL